MKAILALIPVVVLGFAAAGCGPSERAASGGPITVAGATTISNVKVGALIRCKDGPAARVPRWLGPTYLRVPGVPGLIQLKHRDDGSVAVTCKATH